MILPLISDEVDDLLFSQGFVFMPVLVSVVSNAFSSVPKHLSIIYVLGSAEVKSTTATTISNPQIGPIPIFIGFLQLKSNFLPPQ